GTTLKRYHADGTTLTAPASAVKLPGDLLNSVTAVLGLDDSTKAVPAIAQRPAATRSGKATPAAPAACDYAKYWQERQVGAGGDNTPRLRKHEGNFLCPYTPSQIRSAYGLGNNVGTGQTIAIVDAYDSASLSVDANKYNANYGLPQLTSKNF